MFRSLDNLKLVAKQQVNVTGDSEDEKKNMILPVSQARTKSISEEAESRLLKGQHI
jgi:hypothetical protein